MTHAAQGRVLMITERYPPDIGGVSRSGQRIAAAIARLGMRVHVLCWTRQIPAGSMETTRPELALRRDSGLLIHRVGLFASWDLTLQHTMNVLEWLHCQHCYDVIWGHYLYPSGFTAVLFGESASVASVVSARGNDIDRLVYPPGDFARLQWTLSRASLVTAVSNDLARKISVLMGQGVLVEVIGNTVDTEVFSPGAPPAGLRERLGILPDEVVLGFSGELRHRKGIDFLLGALTEVRKVRPACLLVIGETRPDDEIKLMTYAAANPADADRIIVTGHLTEPAQVAEHLRLCDVFLLPSVSEGLPNALLEAMACGLPVIASNAGGIPEVIEHGTSGLILPRPSLHKLGEAILDFLNQPVEARNAMREAARRRIETAFHSGVEAAALARVFARVMPKKKPD